MSLAAAGHEQAGRTLATMRAPEFKLEPVDESFFDNAPFRIAETFEIPASAESVWAELTSDNPLSWCRILRDLTWTTPKPYGVGTTRTVRTIANANIFHERFFVWEEGRRKAFYVEHANGPLFRRFAEDYRVEPTSETSCEFTWIIAAQPRRAAALTNPVNKLLLSSLFRDTRKHFHAT
jgi:hypothetical protein